VAEALNHLQNVSVLEIGVIKVLKNFENDKASLHKNSFAITFLFFCLLNNRTTACDEINYDLIPNHFSGINLDAVGFSGFTEIRGNFKANIFDEFGIYNLKIHEINFISYPDPTYNITGYGKYTVVPSFSSNNGFPATIESTVFISVNDGNIYEFSTDFIQVNENFPLIYFTSIGFQFFAIPDKKETSIFFRRGDVDGDGFINISDPINILDFFFASWELPRCLKASDIDDDGSVNVGDVIQLLNYLFTGNRDISAPSPLCGIDCTEDLLYCYGQYGCMPELVP
jgi:hypothetical protein